MESVAPKKKRPLWLWILLFITAVFLAFIGYALTISGFEVANYFDHPGMTIVAAAVILGLYALLVRLFEQHWARDLSLKKLIPHTLLGLLVGCIYMVLVVSTITASGSATVSWKGFSGESQFTVAMLFLAVAVGEEMICRGVIFRWIDERWNTWAAMLVSALLFGKPVDPAAHYRVATIDYVAQGNDGLSAFKDGTDLNSPQNELDNARFLIMNYFKYMQAQGKAVDAQVEGRVRFEQ